jgi:single-strand DNA-binding protein
MPSGKAVTSFSIAVGSQWKSKDGEKQESTEWVNITAFDKLGEICAEWLKKGSQVFISGKMKTDKYEKDGITRYSTKIIADNMQMLGGKSQGGEPQEHTSGAAGNTSTATEHTSTAGASAHPKAARPVQSFENFDDDIPFSPHGKCGAGVSWRCM